MPVLRLTNTLTRRKEPFAPIDPARVRLYACGPTVYDDAHIGNARPIIVFDLLFRLLRHLYGPEHVTYARNLTDVDDKINARAAERGVSIRDLTDETIARFHEDIRALGVLMPEDVNVAGAPPRLIEPRATDHIGDMRTLIERLVAEGHAYVAEEHVLFSVPSMPEYGQLSRRPLDEMEAGARIDVAPYKRSPLDFVLWKPSPPAIPGWDSPCAIATQGRPGWHIECSAMSWRHLGETFDIHAGGIDLVFPHHENELAQSRCCFGTPVMANVWLHNGFLQVEGQKMSKSTGNFVTVRELRRGWRGQPWPGVVLRMSMLSTHYRQPLDWTAERLIEAKAHIQMLLSHSRISDFIDPRSFSKAWSGNIDPSDQILAALLDDLNTADAVNNLKGFISRAQSLSDEDRIQMVHDARFLGLVSFESSGWLTASQGLSQMPPQLLDHASIKFRDYRVSRANHDTEMSQELENWFQENEIAIRAPDQVEYYGSLPSAGGIERLIVARTAARAAKNWAESDRIRDELAAMGITLKDNKDGTTTWEVAR